MRAEAERSAGLPESPLADLSRASELYRPLIERRSASSVCQAGAALARFWLSTQVAWCAELIEEELVIAGHVGLMGPEMARSWRLPLGAGIGGWVAETGRAVVIRDYLHDPRRISPVKSIIDSEQLRSGIVAPLRDGATGEAVLGVVYVANRFLVDFSQEHVQVAASLACEIGSALAACRRIALLQAHAEDLQEELRQAHLNALVSLQAAEALSASDDLELVLKLLSERLDADVSLLDTAGHELLSYTRSQPPRSPGIGGALDETAEQPSPVLYSHPLSVGNEELGTLSVSAEQELSSYHQDALSQVAAVCVLELLRQRSALDAELRLHLKVLDDLLSGTVSEGDIFARASMLGMDLRSPHVVACVGGHAGRGAHVAPVLTRRVVEAVTDAARRFYRRPFVSLREGVAFIVAQASEQSMERIAANTSEVVKQASASLGGLGLSGGVGRLCLSPVDFAEAAREARLALDISKIRAAPGEVVTAGELGFYPLLARASGEKALEALVADVLGPLLEADSSGRSDYLATLEAYLVHDRCLEEASRSLHIHVNTLRYRLRKIETMLGADLHDAEDRFRVELALRMQRMRAFQRKGHRAASSA
ncbi:MAG: helix-turn-helix domain-containing protein [Actinobacteria bacterium]|nr:helix-turn-helix domain-containing protein [Actinomycetota bacterium]